MGLLHSPSSFTLALGGAITLVDLCLALGRSRFAKIEELLMLRHGSGRLLDLAAEAGLVEVSHDAFGDPVDIKYRADPATIVLALARRAISHVSIPARPPLPNLRLKLSGLPSRESAVRSRARRRRTGRSLAPADLPPAA